MTGAITTQQPRIISSQPFASLSPPQQQQTFGAVHNRYTPGAAGQKCYLIYVRLDATSIPENPGARPARATLIEEFSLVDASAVRSFAHVNVYTLDRPALIISEGN